MKRLRYKVFMWLAIGVLILVTIINYFNNTIFQRFFGNINPILIFLLSSVLGLVLLSVLVSKGWFSIYEKRNYRELLYFFKIAFPFTLIAILVDLIIVFPSDTNINFPMSLLFYPAMGFLVEILFHLLPLSLLIFTSTFLLQNISTEKIIWFCFLITATLEPTYQVVYMNASPEWTVIIVWLNLFLFNLAQLFVFKKYDFISMYLVRLFYYLIWHILWGQIRLAWLF